MNLTKSLQALACATAMAMGAGAASAVPVSFTHYNDGASSGAMLSCGATGQLNRSCSVTTGQWGLGVNGRPDAQSHLIDGRPVGSAERLTISFAADMIWNSITFGYWDHNDDVTLVTDDGTSFWYNGNSRTVDLGGAISSSLSIIARGTRYDCNGYISCNSVYGGNDEFSVKKIDVAPVPLPAAGGMLLAGLGAFAFMRRRKKA